MAFLATYGDIRQDNETITILYEFLRHSYENFSIVVRQTYDIVRYYIVRPTFDFARYNAIYRTLPGDLAQTRTKPVENPYSCRHSEPVISRHYLKHRSTQQVVRYPPSFYDSFTTTNG